MTTKYRHFRVLPIDHGWKSYHYSFYVSKKYAFSLLISWKKVLRWYDSYPYFLRQILLWCDAKCFKILLIYLREGERARGEKQRERDKQTPRWVQSPRPIWSYNPEIKTWAKIKSQMLNQLNNPGALWTTFFWSTVVFVFLKLLKIWTEIKMPATWVLPWFPLCRQPLWREPACLVLPPRMWLLAEALRRAQKSWVGPQDEPSTPPLLPTVTGLLPDRHLCWSYRKA